MSLEEGVDYATDIHTTSGMFSDKKHVHSSQLLRETLSAASLNSGGKGIDKLTWHHHQDTGRMQLIPRDKHNETGHVGGMDLWFK